MPLAPLAQSVELRTFNPQVMGSSPIGRTLGRVLVLAFLQHTKRRNLGGYGFDSHHLLYGGVAQLAERPVTSGSLSRGFQPCTVFRVAPLMRYRFSRPYRLVD